VFARAASAPTPRRRALSDSTYLAVGAAAFLVAAAIQYGLYHRFLREPLRAHDVEKARPAFIRWISIAIVWQVLVLGGSAAYMLALSSRHGPGIAWVTPAVGATFGTALPLQFVAMAALRFARGA
jgi:hypothetical protein